jgi:sugar transferase (PEP-CTERM/EpsH1 system associated)
VDELLFLAHRIPYPPDKGDKIRSWHFLKYLTRQYRVNLGCLIDDNRDWEFTEFLRSMCHECCFVALDASFARLRSLRGFADGQPLTLPYYFDVTLSRWVTRILSRPRLSRVFIYCSAMAQYVPLEFRRSLRSVADLVDVDSEKWFDYARGAKAPKSWLWKREGRRLQEVERAIVKDFAMTLVATVEEMEMLRRLAAPEAQDRINCVTNGVDTDFFSPDRQYATPPEIRGTPLVFTGAMDYRPNVDAVTYFSRAILPRLRQRIPDVSFYVVGSNPKPEVEVLRAEAGVVVTGRVPDVRPYIAHARAVVAPLRIGRGVQNKVLEGMAMAKPVVASPEAITGINAKVGTEILVADGPIQFADAVCRAIDVKAGAELGRNARLRVLADHEWLTSLNRLGAAFNA